MNADDSSGPRLLADGRDVAPLLAACTFRTRFRGLLGRDALDGAIWIEPCTQVHTFGMRFPIDVAYVARSGRVLLTSTLVPGRLGPLRLRARAVVEAEAGRFEGWGLRAGVVVQVSRTQL